MLYKVTLILLHGCFLILERHNRFIYYHYYITVVVKINIGCRYSTKLFKPKCLLNA